MESRALARVTENEAYELMVKGFSPNYRGNPDLDRNRSAAIPPDANCSLFITGLAPTLTTRELLAGIRDAGRIYATHINAPEPDRGHNTCAAKVVFFERGAAERFYHRFAATGFAVRGHPMHVGRVVWNRIRSAELDVGGRKSRVLLISGPPGIVNERALRAYFSSKIQYQVDEVRAWATSEDRALIEFRFGSYRCQAESARMALAREFKEFGVFCEFGESTLPHPLLENWDRVADDGCDAYRKGPLRSHSSSHDLGHHPESYLIVPLPPGWLPYLLGPKGFLDVS
ncbi:hypothetical protein B0H67DRAFT_665333 [Lasiosphaeris hirsuta]|uniref:RRM domain-containing protein n=1 Tax=Lasiosphaeris hirsuta TaxID=260670 RepID=A0AA40DXH0_9PEZI|nr:hypothetical protein B0H67DRAFT_665333 [Lasiosphaeris hirsuta]